MTKVVFPCDQSTWWQVKAALHNLKDICLQEDVDWMELAETHQRIIHKNKGYGDNIDAEFETSTFYGLVKFYTNPDVCCNEEGQHFRCKTLPRIVDLALKIEELLPIEGLSVYSQQSAGSQRIERQLCCSILSCGFLCLFPDENRPFGTKLPNFNFNSFFKYLHIPSQIAKLRCILNYFDRAFVEWSNLSGTVLFIRQVVKWDELPTLDTWLNCSSALCDIVVRPEGAIEEAGCDKVEVDFANRYIGGGVLNRGRVQEEIRFSVCPELMVAMVFMEAMDENEAIVMKGYEQFSYTVGYGSDLMFVGDCKQETVMDADGSLKSMLCAIDAVSYRHNTRLQYLDNYLLRDLNKAFIGFCTPFPMEETMSEESYTTAEEETDEWKYNNDQEWNSRINEFVDEILRQAVRQALPEAASLSRYNRQQSRQQSDEAPMSHLEVNFREWYANYRRRSSNLSDISSRRSSGCSTRGYSSEFSSEFEEYYDNFQLQESRYKYHTIKEESGSAVLNEFASNLIATLLQEGTREACNIDKELHRFHGTRPEHVLHQPSPQRVSSLHSFSENADDDIDEYDSDSDEKNDSRAARLVVDKMFNDIWPFSNNELDNCCERDSESPCECRAMRECILHGINSPQIMTFTQDGSSEETGESSEYEASSDPDADVGISAPVDENAKVIDDAVLLYVAERIVALAFDEALADYRYRYVNPRHRMEPQLSIDSTISDHSTELQDQSDSSKSSAYQESDQLETSRTAEKVAEKVLQELFKDNAADDPSNDGDPTQLPLNTGVPRTSDCDTGKGYHVDVEPESTATSSVHSNNNSDKDSVNPNVSERHLQMYSRIADKLIMGGFSAIGVDHDRLSSSVIKTKPVVQLERNRSSSFSVAKNNQSGKKTLSRGLSCDQAVDQLQSSDKKLVVPCKTSSMSLLHPSDNLSSQKLAFVNQTLGNTCSNKQTSHSLKTGGKISRSSSLKSRSSRLSDKRNSSSSSEGKCPSDGSYSNLLNKRSSSSSSEGKCPVDSCYGNNSINANKSEFPHSPPRSGNSSSSPGNQSVDNDKTGSEVHSIVSLAQTGSRLHLSAGEKRSAYIGGARPKTYLQPPEAHYSRQAGHKKNYDQFANSLSRDLLTNAFLQVQEQSTHVVCYPRRSSEPMQISNGAALQRLENSMYYFGGRQSQKSKTDEDICLAEESWAQNGPFCDVGYRGGSSPCGFKDPILSRFAEELMKANVSVPTLQLLSDCVSTSGSSRSVCSTVSSFRDPLLASFDEELINSYPNNMKSGARTQMSWSKMKTSMLSQRAERRSSQNSVRKPRVNSVSVDSEVSGVSWKSFKSNTVVICSEDVSDFAERLSRQIMCEALTAAFCTVRDSVDSVDISKRRMMTLEMFGEMLACHILQAAVNAAQTQMSTSDWLEQNKIVTWSEETECLEYSGEGSTGDSETDDDRRKRDSVTSSSVYEDALDIPYHRLEEFASMLAEQVLINSLAMSQRERNCAFRRQYGRSIATGNWGCGAFCGDPHLKALLQWMAASYAGAPEVIYYTFGHHKMNKFEEVVKVVIQEGWDVSKLMQAVRRYCIITEKEITANGAPSHDLFEVILQGEIFPGL